MFGLNFALPRAPMYGPGSEIFAGATLDLQFAADPVGSAARVTCVRASSDYADNESGVWLPFANNIPRITNKGLLVEESRTNSIRNNSMQGASAPSTLPTNWITALGGDASLAVVETGTEDGVDYIDIRYTGTSAGAGSAVLIFESTTQIVAADTQTWASSFFAKLIAGSAAGVTTVNRINFRTAAGASVTSQDVSFTPTATRLGLQRTINVFTASGGTIARVTNTVAFASGSGASDITLRIGWPQLELGAFATSPIRTTSAAATRAADVITVTSPPAFGSAYSLFAEGAPNAPTTYGTNQSIFAVDAAGDANNRSYMIRVASTGLANVGILDGGVAQLSVSSAGAWAVNTVGKIAAGIENGSQVGVFNGSVLGAQGSGTMPDTPTVMRVGTNSASGTQWNGYIRRVAYFPTRLTNAQLQTITG